jgi:rRNA maturation protein Nop10
MRGRSTTLRVLELMLHCGVAHQRDRCRIPGQTEENPVKVPPTDAPRPAPRVHLYCPECGEPTVIRSLMPMMFAPSIDEITHSCGHCGADTKVEIIAQGGLRGQAARRPVR